MIAWSVFDLKIDLLVFSIYANITFCRSISEEQINFCLLISWLIDVQNIESLQGDLNLAFMHERWFDLTIYFQFDIYQ